MILMDISAFHLKGFSFSLLQMLCYLFASQSHWARPTNPHSLIMMMMRRRMRRTVLVLLTIDC